MGPVEIPPERASRAQGEEGGENKRNKDVLNKKGLEPKRRRREIDA